MACLTENQIVEFFSPQRSREIAAQVDAHASGCEKCRRLLAEYALLAGDATLVQPDRPGAAAAVVAAAGTAGLAAAPTLTPIEDSRHDRVELVHRLAQAQARKYIGKVLKGKWEIEELIGTGGMAHVFAARHRNGRRVAIKCMRPELMLERSLVERFLREGYVANKIDHPGAVAILDDDVMDDGTPFLVMELLVGRALRERLNAGPLALDDALRAIAQVLDLLAVAHDKGIIHRDLKPDNLFETEDGTIKVLDFGIARLKERAARPDLETRSGLTMGTIGYMPAEQARGLAAQVDARSDVWAMGATLYSLLTARRLHEATTTNESLLLAMTSPVPPMSELVPSLPRSVQSLLDVALAFDKNQRFSSARAMKDALSTAMSGPLDETTILAQPSMPPAAVPALNQTAVVAVEGKTAIHAQAQAIAQSASPPRKFPAGRIAGVVLALIVAAGATLFISTSRNKATTTPPPPEPAIGLVAPEPAASPTASTAPTPPPTAPTPTATPAKVTVTPTRAPAPKPKPRPSSTPTPTSDPAPIDTRDPLGPQH